jgi:hypothetical protein
MGGMGDNKFAFGRYHLDCRVGDDLDMGKYGPANRNGRQEIQ